MTFVQHGVMPGLIAHYAGCPWEVCAGVALIGAAPDLLAMPETIHGNYTNLYQRYHSWSGNWLVWLGVPDVHIAIDKFWHKKTGGWYWWGYVVEPLVWIGEILLVWRFR